MKRILGFLPLLPAFGCGQLLGVNEFHGGSGAGGASASAGPGSAVSSVSHAASSASTAMSSSSNSSGTGGTLNVDPCKGTSVGYVATDDFLMTSKATTVNSVAPLPGNGRVFGGDYEGMFAFNPVNGDGPGANTDHQTGFVYGRIDSPFKDWAPVIDAEGMGRLVDVAAVDSDATSVATVGEFLGSQLDEGANIPSSGTTRDGFVVRYDTGGTFKSAGSMRGDGIHETGAVAVRLVQDNPTVLGYSSSPIVKNGAQDVTLAKGKAQPYGFVIGYDDKAIEAWSLTIDGPNANSQILPKSLAISQSSSEAVAVGLAMAKDSPNVVYLNNAAATQIETQTNQTTTLFVAAFTIPGGPPPLKYLKLFDGPFAYAVVDYDKGAPVIAAALGAGELTIGGQSHNIVKSALFVAKLDDSGNPMWAKLIQNDGDLVLRAARAAAQPEGGVWVAGGFSSASNSGLDFGGGAIMPASDSHRSGFAALLDAGGCQRFAMSFRPLDIGGDLTISGVAANASPNAIFLAGNTSGGVVGFADVAALMGPGGLSVTLVPSLP